eukprot:CAMPEP_0184695866 /NCGR_PEP_ID=MMETSP0313-20130426/3358_1 /TAXON_ID=2792 /ORGANISM="Porphyridium aerugineum, Strain SAG 1380-2" /LENGTH=1054 /DNA_ID=CAMNT_0027154393 /DNA_START=262 /DNA_END=3422 /DNA_ORIENTATION=+
MNSRFGLMPTTTGAASTGVGAGAPLSQGGNVGGYGLPVQQQQQPFDYIAQATQPMQNKNQAFDMLGSQAAGGWNSNTQQANPGQHSLGVNINQQQRQLGVQGQYGDYSQQQQQQQQQPQAGFNGFQPEQRPPQQQPTSGMPQKQPGFQSWEQEGNMWQQPQPQQPQAYDQQYQQQTHLDQFPVYDTRKEGFEMNPGMMMGASMGMGMGVGAGAGYPGHEAPMFTGIPQNIHDVSQMAFNMPPHRAGSPSNTRPGQQNIFHRRENVNTDYGMYGNMMGVPGDHHSMDYDAQKKESFYGLKPWVRYFTILFANMHANIRLYLLGVVKWMQSLNYKGAMRYITESISSPRTILYFIMLMVPILLLVNEAPGRHHAHGRGAVTLDAASSAIHMATNTQTTDTNSGTNSVTGSSYSSTTATNTGASAQVATDSGEPFVPVQNGVVNIGPNPASPEGVSVVAVCMNRHSTLEKTLPTWLKVNNAREVIVVDWSSNPPLHDTLKSVLTQDPRVRIIRVEGEDHWVLSRAFNIGMSMARGEYILRTDCDYDVKPNIVEMHPIAKEDKRFYSGNWKKAKNENEVHLNGVVIIRRMDYWKVLGYDERIQTYGWDDEDLYTRLEHSGLERKDVDYQYVSHVQHDDKARAQTGVRFVEVEVDFNRVLLDKMDKWSPEFIKTEGFQPSSYAVEQNTANYGIIKANHKPQSLLQLTAPSFAREAWDLGLGRRLHDEYGTPWNIIVSLDTKSRENLLASLMKYEAELKEYAEEDTPEAELKPSILMAHVQHGLGNRLRALGSALAFAKATRRGLIIIWEQDSHVQAKMSDLFNTSHLSVMSELKPKWPFTDEAKWDKAWEKIDSYNYMEAEGPGAVKGQQVVDKPGRPIYFRGAYVMENAKVGWRDENEALKSLPLHPEVEQILAKFNSVSWEDVVSVHIRNRVLSDDIKSVDPGKEYGQQALGTIDSWRQKSNYANFIPKLQKEVEANPKAKFYVAADTVDVYPKLRETFGDRVIDLPRTCDSRELECIRYALADMLLLAKGKYLLGSGWSSFTECAARFGGFKYQLA